jgi:hypothetical protein
LDKAASISISDAARRSTQTLATRMNRVALVFALSLAWWASSFAGSPGGTVPSDVEAWLKHHIASLKTIDGEPVPYYPQFNSYAEGHLNGRPAVAVVFTLEGIGGGVNWQRMLAVFWKRHGMNEFCCSRQVGGKGIRSADDIEFVAGKLRVRGNTYAPSDGLCCPSKPYSTLIAVEKSQLVESGSGG